jgi:YgiT-type zinc finger domain-containing protein
MKPDSCPLCGGKIENGKTTFTADTGNEVVVIRNVHAWVCTQCGEEWIDNATAQKIESITEDAHAKKHQVEIVAL